MIHLIHRLPRLRRLNDSEVAADAIAEAKKQNWNGLCVAVVGPSGDLGYFEKQENCQSASISISQHRARTAARYRRPDADLRTFDWEG